MTIADDRSQLLTHELLRLLREHLDEPALSFAEDPTRLTGGFWAELIAFRLSPRQPGWADRLVARVMPDAVIAAKEVTFQHEVAERGYPTPAVRLARGPEAGIDGRSVMVMDLAEGAPLLADLDGMQAIPRLPSLARRLPTALAEALARLHALDTGPVAARLAAGGAPRPDLDGMLRDLRATALALHRPALGAAVEWLADHRPRTDSEVLGHGDLHPFNLLVDRHGGLTVLDWSAAVIAPRAYDLAFTSLMLAEPPLVAPRALRPLVRRTGRALARRFLRSYESQAGVRVDRAALEWCQGLVCVRALSEVASWSVGGSMAARAGHPWVINQVALIARLTDLTGIAVPTEPATTVPRRPRRGRRRTGGG